MHLRRVGTHVEVLAPAKVNLFLEVLAKRPDGYHDLETLLVAVTIYDTLTFAPHQRAEIDLHCRWAAGCSATELARCGQNDTAGEAIFASLPVGPQNLVWKALDRLRTAAAIKTGASVRLVKRIPATAGLGGASSDAAAALLAANEAWKLHWPRHRLADLAADVGSDVPFFLTRGAAVCRGRGEQVQPLRIPRLQLVIAKPPVGLSTPQVFRACRPAQETTGADVLIAALARGDAAAAGRQMTNGLQLAAEGLTPWIARLQDEFQRHGLNGHQMSGSGSSYFGLCQTARQARRIAARLRARGAGSVYAAASACMPAHFEEPQPMTEN
jgi:4-diphosphocytidyl-2-C-methyl-D-erythritol kinase